MGFCSGMCANMKWDSILVLKDVIWPGSDVLYPYTYPNSHLVEPRYPHNIGWYNQSVTFCLLLLHLATSVAHNNFCNLCRYATACARSDGLLLLCGGRDATSVVCYQDLHKAAHFNMWCGVKVSWKYSGAYSVANSPATQANTQSWPKLRVSNIWVIIWCNSTEEAIVFLFELLSYLDNRVWQWWNLTAVRVYLYWRIGTYYVLYVFVQPLDSAYGLAKHRDGRWEWAVAPGISPSPRYQHAAVSLFSFSSIY